MSLHGNLINGEWLTATDVNRDVNPSNVQEVVGEYARADAAQTQAAIAAARAAFPGWSRGNRQERADLLDRVGDEILRRAEELGTLLSREQYLTDVSRWGYADGRVAPHGPMTAEDVAHWTAAIEAETEGQDEGRDGR